MQEMNSSSVKKGLASMLKGGVIMDVTSVEQARIAEQSGAVSVMVLDNVPADIVSLGKIARMANLERIMSVKASVSIPVMAKVRIGHVVEAKLLETMEIDYIDESEVLTPADTEYIPDKASFKAPFVCGVDTLKGCLDRLIEGASMLRSKGKAGTGNVFEATKHLKSIKRDIEFISNHYQGNSSGFLSEFFNLPRHEQYSEIIKKIATDHSLPVVLFAAGGIATPADAALMRYYGADGVFVGSGIFKSGEPEKLAKAIVRATSNWQDYHELFEVSKKLKDFM
jgi:pyridoxal 5'-phosphate synthase pdxS subunit